MDLTERADRDVGVAKVAGFSPSSGSELAIVLARSPQRDTEIRERLFVADCLLCSQGNTFLSKRQAGFDSHYTTLHTYLHVFIDLFVFVESVLMLWNFQIHLL
jgi:hypothetical protein